MADNWIQGAVKRPGALTRKANKAGEGVQTYARQHAHDKGLTGQQARLAMTFNKLRKAANGAVMEIESADTHAREKDEPPLDLNSNEPNMVLVGDGGKDPGAEEYLYIPPGNEAIVAPKLSPDEEPNMSNAMRAIADVKLRKAASGAGTQILYKGPEGASTRAPSHVNVYKPATPAPDYFNPKFGATAANPWGTANDPYTGGGSSGGGGGGYDSGVGSPSKVQSTLTSASDIDNIIQQTTNPAESQFMRSARNILGAAHGLITEKLHRAAGGSLVGGPGGVYGQNAFGEYVLQPVSGTAFAQAQGTSPANDSLSAYQKASLDYQKQQLAQQNRLAQQQYGLDERQLGAQQAYWTGGLEQQRYATDAQRAIAQMNIDAQNAQNAANLQYQRERLALDRLLGERQAQADEKRALTDQQRAAAEAQQLLMTRAGRQLVAPGGNTIPSLQPLLGRSIN